MRSDHAGEIAAGDRFALGKNWRGFLDHLDEERIRWLGGYPFEVARPEEIFNFYSRHGFRLETLVTCQGGWANNEFVFRAPDTELRSGA